MKHRLTRRTLALVAACALSFSLPAALANKEEAVTVAAFAKNGPTTNAISFSPADFLVLGDKGLSSIILNDLPDPAAGVLTIGGQMIPAGSEVAMSAVSGLRFSPLATPMLSATSFTFTPVFDDGATGEAVTVGLFLLSEENDPPVAENLSLTTYKNVEVQGTFAAVDPEGDILTFQLISKPARGTVSLAEDGSGQFTYTPYENKTGKDAFTYVAIDAKGNTSSPATVSVKIEKQKTKVTYSDMTGVEGHREAVRLAEAGILVGEQMGSGYFFRPQERMDRAQFTALAMMVCEPDSPVGPATTGFADDEAMAAWAKPYVSAALLKGLVQGSYSSDGEVVFLAHDPITAAEAAVLLDRALRITSVAETITGEPSWYSQAVANLNSCDALPASAMLDEPLTRAQAAIMLSGALDVLANRESSWLK